MANVTIVDVKVGSGAAATAESVVVVTYSGTVNGAAIPGASVTAPVEIKLFEGIVIEGFRQGVTGMQPGGQRTVTIPPELAYKNNGVRPANLDVNQPLVFTIDLVSVADFKVEEHQVDRSA